MCINSDIASITNDYNLASLLSLLSLSHSLGQSILRVAGNFTCSRPPNEFPVGSLHLAACILGLAAHFGFRVCMHAKLCYYDAPALGLALLSLRALLEKLTRAIFLHYNIYICFSQTYKNTSLEFIE